MAHLHRLIFAAFLAVFSLSADALIPTGTQYRLVLGTGYPGDWMDTLADACISGVNAKNADPNDINLYSFVSVSGGQCLVGRVRKDNGAVIGNGLFTPGVRSGFCPANSTAVSGGCQCTAPYVENAAHTACEAPQDPCLSLKGAIYGETEWASTTKGPNYACLGGGGANATCQTVAVCDYTSQVPGQTGYTCRGIAYATGTTAATCTGNGETPQSPSPAPIVDPVNPDKEPVPGQPAPARCPAGQAPGEFNGTRMCMPTGGDTQTSTPAPGSGTTTTNNSDGSSTTSTTSGRTECKQGQCTTTTNNTNTTINAPGNSTCPAGQASGTTTVNGQTRTTCTGTSSGTTTEAQSGFCEKNPKDKQCDGDGSDTSFGGSCAGGFKAVSDDAVINAMAEEQYKRNCQFFEKVPDPTEDTQAHDEMRAKGKQGIDQTADLPADSKRNYSIGPADFDSSSAIGAQQCFSDKSVQIWGRTIAIPLSIVCPWLAILGNILVVVGYLLAARIVIRG